MPLITLMELFRIIVIMLALAYIFSIFIPKQRSPFDLRSFRFEDFKIAVLISAPAVILHELAHKFTAMFFGLDATFFASYFGLAIGVLLRAIHSPFLIIVPGYVQISTNATVAQTGIIAFAGPFVNLLLWLIPAYILKTAKKLKRKTVLVLYLTKKINMILFLFNMIPFGFFDGAKVFKALFSLFS
jgi:Zn-dependent protease